MQPRVLAMAVVYGGLAVAGVATPGVAQEGARWSSLGTKGGISVSEKEVGGGLPMYRGETRVNGPVLEVLAVILDDERSKEWAKDVSEAEIVRVVDDYVSIIYSRANQMWPIRDRDMVMKRTVKTLKPAESYYVQLVCVPQEKPEVSKVVRIKDCESSFTLRKLDDNTTEVVFQMRVEPGGSHPEWAVRRASRSVPYDTLQGLQRQVQRTHGQYAAFVRKYQTL